MTKLDKQCQNYRHRPVRLVSFAFEIPNKLARAKEDGVFVYEYGVTKDTRSKR